MEICGSDETTGMAIYPPGTRSILGLPTDMSCGEDIIMLVDKMDLSKALWYGGSVAFLEKTIILLT